MDMSHATQFKQSTIQEFQTKTVNTLVLKLPPIKHRIQKGMKGSLSSFFLHCVCSLTDKASWFQQVELLWPMPTVTRRSESRSISCAGWKTCIACKKTKLTHFLHPKQPQQAMDIERLSTSYCVTTTGRANKVCFHRKTGFSQNGTD